MVLQALLEENGKLFLKEKAGTTEEKIILPHPNFRLVCSGNTLGQGDDTGHYAGTNVQNSSTLDRFQTVIRLGYLSKAHEREILKGAMHDAVSDDIVEQMLSFARLIRDAYVQHAISLTMSPRTLINWVRKIGYWKDPVFALKLAFFDKLVDEDKRTCREFVDKVFGKQI